MILDENGNPIPQRRRMAREIEVGLDDPRLTLHNPRTVFAESEDQRYPEFARPTSPVQNPIDWAIRSADSHKLDFASNVDLAQALYYKSKGDMDAASAQLGEYDRMQRMAMEAGPAIQTREDVDAAGGGVGANAAWLGHQAMGLVPDVLSAVGAGIAGSFVAPGAGTIAGAVLPFVGKRAAVSGLRAIARRELASEMGEAAAKRVSGDVLQNRVEALAGRLGAEGVADVGKAALRQQAGRAGRVAGVIAGGVPGVAGGQAEQIKAADQEDAQKLAVATLASSTIGALPFERFFGQFGKKAMDKAMRDTAKFLPRVAKEFGKQGLAEGSAEFAQAVTERLGHKWVDENVEWLSADAFSDYLTNFAAGFVAGGALGAGGEGFRTGGRFVTEKAGQFRDAVKGTIKQLADARRAKRGELTPSEAEARQSDTEATRAANVATGTERTPRRGPAGSFLARLQRMWGNEKEDQDLSDEADAITQFEVSRRVTPVTGDTARDALLSFVDLDNSEFTSVHAVADTLTRYVRGEATDEDFVQIDALGFKPGARNALDLVAERWTSQLDAADSMLSEAGSLQDEIEQAERAFGAASADSDAADHTYEDAEAESSRENEYGGINVHDGVPFEENTPLEIQLGNEFSARALRGTPGKVIDEKGAALAEGRARAEQHSTLYGAQGRREAALANKLGVRPTPNERSARRALLDAHGSKGLLGDTNHLGIFGDNVWSSKDETGPNSVAEKIKSPRFVEISADWDNIPEVTQRLSAGDAPRTAIMLDNLVSQVRGQSRGKLTGEQALEKALVDLTLAGVTIDLDTLTPGELKSGKGDVVLNLTEKMVGDLQVAVRKARSGRIQGPLTLDNAYARDQPRKAAGARMPLDEARASAVAEARNAGYPNLAAYAASRQMTISELIERTATRSPQRAAVSVARSLASEDGYQPGDSIDPAEWREYMSRAQAILDDRRANARRDATKFDAGVAREAGSGDFDTEADTALVPRVTPPGASNAIEATRYETEGNGKNAPLGRKIDADGFTPTMSPMVDVGRHTPADTAERISSEEDGDLTDADAKNTKQRLQEGMRLITGERRRFNAYDVADVINEINDVRPGTERAYLIYIAERFADGSPNGVIAKALEARQQRLEESKDIPSEVKSNADAGVEATAARRDKGQRKVDPDAPPIIYDDGNMQRPAKNLMDDLGPAAKPKPSVATRTSARLPTRDEKVDPRPDNRRIPETPGPTTKLAQSPVPPFALRSQDDDGVAHAGPDRNAPRPAMKSVHTKKPQKSTDTIAFEFDETPEGIEFSERVDTLRAKLAQAVGRTDVDAQTRAQLMKSIRRVEQRMQQAREQYAARAKTVTPRGSTKADKDVQEALASPEYTRDTKKLAEVASAILERLGFKTDVSVKTHKSNFSGQMHYVNGKLVLRVGAGLRGAERIEVLTHEIGHHVIHSYIAEAAGITIEDASRMQPNELLAAITKVDPKLGAALKADYDTWRAAHPAAATARDVRISRAGAARAEGLKSRASGSKPADDYDFSFDEWLADNIGRALNKNAEVQGIVGKFFKRVADTLRKLYDTMFDGKAKQFAPAPSVEAFVQSLFDRDVAAVKAVTGDVVSKSTAQAATSTAIALQLASPPPPPPAGTAATASPAANTPAPTIRSMMHFVRKFLKPEERLILEQAVNRGAINEKMRAFYKDNQLALALMDSAKSGMEARIAMAYLMWQADKVKFGPQANSVFYNTRDNLREILGVASTGDYAHRIFDDIESGRIEAARKNNTPYNVRDIVQRQTGINATSQSIANSVERFQERFVARPWRKFMDSLYSRAAATGVPEMRKLAAMLHRPQFAGEKDRGMLSDTAIVTARYVQAAGTVFKSLSKPHQHAVMQLMKRHADAATLAREPREVQGAVAAMRELFDRADAYLKDAGLEYKSSADFFPVIMDVNTPEAQARLTALLSQPKYEAAVRAAMSANNSTPYADVVKAMVDIAAANPMDAVQVDGPPQFRSENKRFMQFIYDLGDANDIREFADLQNNDPARMVQSYFEPMVKRAEYVRRFGKDGEKLNAMYKRMQDQGATPEDLDLAKNMVAAATGAYASQGSPVIAMVSPELAKRMHGRKSQAFIQGMQAYQNARLLPLSLLSSLMDPLGIALRSGGFDGFWKSFKAGLYRPEIFGGKQPAEVKQMMDQLGVYDYFASHEVLHDLYGAGDNPASRATNDFVFKYNGMSWLQRMTRGMALHAAHGFLLKHGGNMTEHSARYLRELGLKPSDIQGDAARPGRVRVLTGAERNAAAKAAAKAEVARDDRVRDALRRFADEAVLRPNTMQAPLWHADPYMGLVTQYKSFGYAMWDQLGKRLVREAMFNNPGALGAAVAFLPVVIFAELLRELLMFGTDGNPKRAEWGPAEYGNLAVMRTGLLGPNAAMLEDLASDVQNKRLPGSSQIGPAASQAAGMVNALRGYGDLAQEVEETLPANPLYKHHINPLSTGAAP